ncbi:hypothetical protein [Exiguobacterium artemiae]
MSLYVRQYGVSNETKKQIEERYKILQTNLESFTDIYKVDATIAQSTSFKERSILSIKREIAEWQRKKDEEHQRANGSETVDPPNSPLEIRTENVKVKSLVDINTLKTEQDVDKYVNALSHKLKQIIKSNKEIKFID